MLLCATYKIENLAMKQGLPIVPGTFIRLDTDQGLIASIIHYDEQTVINDNADNRFVTHHVLTTKLQCINVLNICIIL